MNDPRSSATTLLACLLVLGLAGGPTATAAASTPPAAPDLAALPLDALLDLPVTGASRLSAPITETAAAVTVLTADQIRALGYRTLSEVLASVRGVMVTTDRSYDYVGVRGFFAPGDYNTRVLLLIDGNRANDNLYDQAYLGTEFPLDLALIDRVEFVPGQASAVYGANALFGVINVVTKAPRATDTFQVELGAGSAGSRSLRLGDTFELPGDTLVQWSLSQAGMEGEDVPAFGTVTPHGDIEQRTTAYLKLRHGELTATALHQDRVKGNPASLDAIAGDTRTRNGDHQTLADMTWVHDTSSTEQATVHAFGGAYRFVGTYAMDYPPPTVNEDIAEGRWWGVEGRVTSTRWEGHRIVLGMEWQESPLLRQTNFDRDPPSEPYLDDRRRSRRRGFFAEDAWQLAPAWTLDASVRHDDFSNLDDETSSRLALIWKPDERLVAKVIAGTAFRPPNAYEAYYQVPGDGGYEINPALHRESVSGTELNIEWRPDAADRLSASIYRNVARDLIVLAFDEATNTFRFENLAAVTARGLELEWEHATAGGARLRANLALQHAHDGAAGEPLATYAPAYLANLTAIVPVVPGLDLGLQGQAVGARGGAGAYSLANATLSSPLQAHGWSWQVGVFNLFDRRHDGPGADLQAQPTIAQPGRSVRLDLVYAF
jgi:outer membrane receptor protein involved in Fe transport